LILLDFRASSRGFYWHSAVKRAIYGMAREAFEMMDLSAAILKYLSCTGAGCCSASR
jgi:hypothetical protein